MSLAGNEMISKNPFSSILFINLFLSSILRLHALRYFKGSGLPIPFDIPSFSIDLTSLSILFNVLDHFHFVATPFLCKY